MPLPRAPTAWLLRQLGHRRPLRPAPAPGTGPDTSAAAAAAAPSARPLTARRATWLVRRRPERQEEHEAAQLAQRHAQHPEVAAAIAFAQDFARLVRERQPDQLDPWLARAAESPLGPLPRGAKGLRDDDDAVKAGVTRPWSHGPVEGQMKRLNMLTRQMCGRAKLALLQQRFLLAASGRCDGGSRGAGLHHAHGAGVSAGSLSTRPPG